MRSARRGNKRDNGEKVAALQKSLKEAEQKVQQAQESRDEIAAQLKALGQVVIMRPWTHEHLEDVWESHCVDFREEYSECEDFEGETDDDAKRWAMLLRVTFLPTVRATSMRTAAGSTLKLVRRTWRSLNGMTRTCSGELMHKSSVYGVTRGSAQRS